MVMMLYCSSEERYLLGTFRLYDFQKLQATLLELPAIFMVYRKFKSLESSKYNRLTSSMWFK